MSKSVILGDIHGRTIWKDIVKENCDADHFIFLGDYVSTHDINISSDIQISNLKEILDFAEYENSIKPGRVILLRGNHDMQHLGYSWAECSGINFHVCNEMIKIKDRFLNATQWVYIDGKFVYSHAGVSEQWMKNNNLSDINQINDLEPSEKFGFTPCKLSDYCGDSVTQPPTWIRPWALCNNAFSDYTYIVGHTSYNDITNIKDELLKSYMDSYFDDIIKPDEKVICRLKEGNDIIVCDTLGVGKYLIVEDNNFTTGKLKQ